MKPSPICVLAFYSESSQAENSYREIRSAGLGRASLLMPDGSREGPRRSCERYGVLRLESESLIVVETETANVEGVIARRRQTGAPAIFMVRAFPATFPGPLETAEPLTGE